jgi:hypothetical protein
MMNKKGLEGGQIGMILVLAIALIVGLVLLQAAAGNVGEVTNTITIANQSLTAAVNGTPQYLTNIKVLTNPVIINATGNIVLSAGNYTIENNVVYNGQEAVKITPDTQVQWKTAWKVSGTGQPTTYDPSAGGRAITSLIIIFGAIALAGAAVAVVIKNDVFNF